MAMPVGISYRASRKASSASPGGSGQVRPTQVCPIEGALLDRHVGVQVRVGRTDVSVTFSGVPGVFSCTLNMRVRLPHSCAPQARSAIDTSHELTVDLAGGLELFGAPGERLF